MKKIADHIDVKINWDLILTATGRTRLLIGAHEDDKKRKEGLEACF